MTLNFSKRVKGLVMSLSFLVGASVAQAATTDTVFLLHGYNSNANSTGQNDAWNCGTTFATQSTVLRAVGITGRIRTVGYYSDNTNCNINLASTVTPKTLRATRVYVAKKHLITLAC